MSQKTRFYWLYKKLNSFNKVWDRQQHPGVTTILGLSWDWGLSFLQEITFTWRSWRQERITSSFNLDFILRADSAQPAAVIQNNGKKFPSGKKSSMIFYYKFDNPKFSLLKPMPIKKFLLKKDKNSLTSPFHIMSQFYWSNSVFLRMNTYLSKLFLQLLSCHSSCMKYSLQTHPQSWFPSAPKSFCHQSLLEFV